MLKHLRLRLTLIYLFAALLLGFTVGGGTYSLATYYFQVSNDHALKVKMGLQFAALDIPLPVDLYEAVRQAGLVITLPITESDGTIEPVEDDKDEGIQENELADIYVLPLTSDGTFITGFNAQLSTVAVDMDAVSLAVNNGNDLRTIYAKDNTPIRILTYRVPEGYGIQVFQMGKYLSLQKLVLRELLNAMIILGGIETLFIGIAAWVLSGRTIRPTQQAWERQQTFVANASHELRSPLTLIQAGVEVALRGTKTENQVQILSNVLSDTDYMNKLIDDLLLLSRLDAQAIKLEIQPIKIISFFPEIINHVNRMASDRHVIIQSEIHDFEILADPLRLKQIIIIVMDNALHNTPDGEKIVIRAYQKDAKGIISITDSGTGIPLEHIDKVFDRFYKVNNRSTLEYKGSGLGLSIAQSLVEAQKGVITIGNSVNGGAELNLAFPVPGKPGKNTKTG